MSPLLGASDLLVPESSGGKRWQRLDMTRGVEGRPVLLQTDTLHGTREGTIADFAPLLAESLVGGFEGVGGSCIGRVGYRRSEARQAEYL